MFCGRTPHAVCSITTPGVHTFGSECQYMCHCNNGEPCNTTTGECTSGCDQYWFGPGCQYRDLAESEFARHTSNIPEEKWAFYANDGDTLTCSYTQVANLSTNIPSWRVLLENEITITDIYIVTTKNGSQYFPDFEVTVEKVSYSDRLSHTKPSDTSICYKHDDTVPDSTSIHVTCTTPLIGNQVRITLSKVNSQLVVCDFRINQGRNLAFRRSVTSSAISDDDNNKYLSSYAVDGLVSSDSQCFRSGSSSDKWLQVEMEQLMDIYYFNIYSDEYISNYKIYDTTSVKELLYDSGSDKSPAIRGYLNRNAQNIRIEKTSGNVMAICELELYGECSDNKWGTSCQNDCGACRQGTCDVVSGCDRGTYGYNCNSICPVNCQNSCSTTIGLCIDGCKPGYFGDKCEQECNSGTYGHNCNTICPVNCKNSCNKISGKCIDGCEPGYLGDDCEQECTARTYGLNCNEQCNGNCVDICNHVTGKCKQCTAGWKGVYCDQECDDGTYGIDCANKCTDKCPIPCDKISGVCTFCQAGWTGRFCEHECSAGTYGRHCNEQCDNNCVDVCNRVTGKCSQCKVGWKGDYCNEECVDGTYGIDCVDMCTDKCLMPCNKVNGICTLCQAGRSGSFCEYECPAGTYGLNCNVQCDSNCVDICNNVTGQCALCKVGWKGDFCDQVLEGQASTTATPRNAQVNENVYDVVDEK
ncbi:transmembrane receptor protein tyrosine kinase [Mactra antiquata]